MTKNKTKYETARDEAEGKYYSSDKFKRWDIGDLFCESPFNEGADWGREYERQRAQKLVDALNFYADGEGDVLDWDRVNNPACIQDRGKHARQALKAYEEDV